MNMVEITTAAALSVVMGKFQGIYFWEFTR
jgi:hypothetical protein